MTFYHSQWFETWAPFAARLIFGFQFLLGAFFKLPWTGFAGEVAATSAAHVPYASVFVSLALLLEIAGALCLIFGWHARKAAIVFAIYVLALGIIFYSNLSDLQTMGMFVSHLSTVAGLLFVSVYGAQHFALRKDPSIA
jgi:putative oxidoreductase